MPVFQIKLIHVQVRKQNTLAVLEIIKWHLNALNKRCKTIKHSKKPSVCLEIQSRFSSWYEFPRERIF
jgi:hypothetical protein